MNVRRAFWPILVSVVFVGVLFAGVFPTRTYLAQRTSTAHAEKQLEVLGQQNDELERRAKELQSDAEIERLAREQYNLVKPGEEAYAILPGPQDRDATGHRPTPPPPSKPGFWSRLWEDVTFWN